MTRSRYSVKESWNRILRALEGKAATSDGPNSLPGEILSENDALSDLAELFEGSLPGETLTLPGSSIPFATIPDMYLATETAEAVSPYTANSLLVWAGIYTSTGTATLTGYASTAFAKITGSFQNSMSGFGALPQPTVDNIMVGSFYGTWRIDWHISFRGSPNILYTVEPFFDNVGLPQAMDKVKPYASGSAVSMGGFGYQYMSGTSKFVDLRLLPDATAWMVIESMQLTAQRVGK